MKRGLLTLALLFGAGMTARADYIIIIANVNQQKDAGAGGAAGAPGAVGAMGAPGAFGAPGAAGMLGRLGNAGAIGPPGAAGAMGFPGAAGMMGGRPPMVGAAGAMGFPGAAGAAGAMGFPGAAGAAGAAGFPGAAGAAGAMGFPGAAGAMGAGQPVPENMGFGGGFAGFFGGGTTTKGPPPIRAMAVIETYNPLMPRPDSPRSNKQIAYAQHKWGESWLWNAEVELVPLFNGRRKLASVSARFDYEKKQLTTKGGKPSAEGLQNLAEWALTHGLIPEFEKTMQELAELDKSNPAADAFVKTKAALAGKIESSTAANRWKDTLFRGFKLATNDFYALLHKTRENNSKEVDSRLSHLKENFVAFYYWHALKGKVLPMPKDKLVCVLQPHGDGGEAFAKQHEIFDSVPLTADSFYSPRYNLVVFSSKRDDRPYRGLVKATENFWTHFNRDDVLKKGATIPKSEVGKVGLTHLIQAETFSLLLRAMEEEQEQAAVSHSATRQILVGAGLMPGTVDLPQWIQSGIGSFMQTPYGSPWRGYGAPHWSYLLTFRELKKDRKLPPAEKLLQNVVLGDFFKEGSKKDPSVKARATAWALTYFLAQKRLDGLHAYFKELSRLPRDLDLDGEALLDCFARAFGCVDAANKRDDRKLADLAESWMTYMEEGVHLDNEATDILAAIHKLQNEMAADLKENEKTPPAPAPAPGPGGFPRPGG
jgi:hypothetical protein